MLQMKDSGVKWIGQIPEDWAMIPNRYLFIDHSTKVGEQAHKYQLLSLTIMGVKEKDINASGGKVPESYDNYQTVEPGDMIFCLFDLDCSAVFSGLSNYSGMITSAYDVLKPNHIYLDNLYADFWFQYIFSNRYYKIYSKNIRYTITTDMFKCIITPIPPIETQRKIGEFLYEKCNKIEYLIGDQQLQIEKLKEYKQAVITEAVTKGLDKTAPMKDSGVEWIGQIPDNWKIEKIKFNTSNRIEKSNGQNFQYIGLENIESFTGKFVETENVYDVTEANVAYKGDVLFGKLRPYLAKAFIANKDIYVSGEFAIFCSDKIFNGFLRYYLVSYGFLDIVNASTYGTKMPRANVDFIKNCYIVLPPNDEQQKIADYLDKKCADIDGLIYIKQQKIEKLQEYKKSLIHEYVTGKKEIA